MDRKKITRELDLYIKQNYRSEGFKLKDFFDAIGDGRTFATGTPSTGGAKWALSFLLDKMELTFAEKLLELIEEKGRKPAEVYTKAGISRFSFSKIKTDKDYHPTKETALALAVALHLDLDETSDLIKRAGFTLSHSSESDLIVEFFIEREVYNIDEINYQLDYRGHKTLTNWRKSKDEQ
ncbi:MAG: XRE family transcriptional regulator [Selenomonadaceae bacterium]|nr:XRE family transcriptional regulator [Selenomonadaceae bacterium]